MISSIVSRGCNNSVKLSDNVKSILWGIEFIFSPITAPLFLIITLIGNTLLLIINFFNLLIHLIKKPNCNVCKDFPGYTDAGCRGIILNRFHAFEALTYKPYKWLILIPGILTLSMIIYTIDAVKSKQSLADLFTTTHIPVLYYHFEDD